MRNIRSFAVGAVAFSSCLFTMLVGCAAQPGDGSEGESETAPTVEASETTPEATGYSCQCPSGEVLDNDGLCYPACPSGYDGVGPVCWQRCASSFYSTGAFCQRDTSIVSANTSSCPWYDQCGLTLKKGCSTCPSGYSNDGCTCRRDAYIYAKRTTTRGAGTAPTCGSH